MNVQGRVYCVLWQLNYAPFVVFIFKFCWGFSPLLAEFETWYINIHRELVPFLGFSMGDQPIRWFFSLLEMDLTRSIISPSPFLPGMTDSKLSAPLAAVNLLHHPRDAPTLRELTNSYFSSCRLAWEHKCRSPPLQESHAICFPLWLCWSLKASVRTIFTAGLLTRQIEE